MKKTILLATLFLVLFSCGVNKQKDAKAKDIVISSASPSILLDSDGDLVPDKDDACPTAAGPASNKGCPEITSEVVKSVSPGKPLDVPAAPANPVKAEVLPPPPLQVTKSNVHHNTRANRQPASVSESVNLEQTNKSIDFNSSELGLKMGTVAFFCENENMKENALFVMKEERSYKFKAMLNPIIEKDEIKLQIIKVINEERAENHQDPITIQDIITRDINLGHYISMQLTDSNNKLNIELVTSNTNTNTKEIYDDSKKQYIDENFEWNWNVTPKPDSKGQTTLQLVISPLNKNKEIIKEKTKSYTIQITFKQSFFASLWETMNTDIKWAIAAIIAPILAFLVARFNKKKEKEEV